MIVKHKNKKIEVPVKRVSFLGEAIGLMFRTRKTPNLLFEFNKKVRMPIHSLFVFFSFFAVWLDENNNILEFQLVHPFKFHISPRIAFSKLIEIPCSSKNRKIIEFFVDKR